MPTDGPPDAPRWSDYLLVGLLSLLLFGYTAFSGRPLTMHEARLPQTSREMLAHRQLLLPTSGGRPWLERPPLPHWVVMSAMAVTGHDDAVWVVRLPSAVMGTITVLCTLWIAGRCFGRTVAVLSGLSLATTFEFYTYAGSAEDDVYLAALVAVAAALFLRGELDGAPGVHPGLPRWLGNRPWHVWGLFLVAGLSNWAKGPLLGPGMLGTAIVACLIWTGLADHRWDGVARLAWAWGLLVAVALTIAWPLWAYHRVPDVVANWRYDYLGRMNGAYSDINQPWWYYAPTLAERLLPWTPACLIGLLASAPLAFRRNGSVGSRFVWCWAIVPVVALSVPHGKHHHYLVPLMAPWAILAGCGLREIGRFLMVPRGPAWLRDPGLAVAVFGLPGAAAVAWFHARIPGAAAVTLGLMVAWVAFVGLLVLSLRRANGPLLTGTVVGGLFVCYGWGMTYAAAATDQTVDDTAFLLRTRAEVPAAAPLYVDAKLGPVGNLDFFRVQFYARPGNRLLHNLSYLRDRQITAPSVYVICRAKDEPKLRQLGTPTPLDQSARSHDMTGPLGRFTLYRLTFDPHLPRYPLPPRPTQLQAMERAESTDPGPWCGPAM